MIIQHSSIPVDMMYSILEYLQSPLFLLFDQPMHNVHNVHNFIGLVHDPQITNDQVFDILHEKNCECEFLELNNTWYQVATITNQEDISLILKEECCTQCGMRLKYCPCDSKGGKAIFLYYDRDSHRVVMSRDAPAYVDARAEKACYGPWKNRVDKVDHADDEQLFSRTVTQTHLSRSVRNTTCFKIAEELIHLAAKCNGHAFGGFVRDAIVLDKKFQDLDLRFNNMADLVKFLSACEERIREGASHLFMEYRGLRRTDPSLLPITGSGSGNCHEYDFQTFHLSAHRKNYMTQHRYLKIDIVLCPEDCCPTNDFDANSLTWDGKTISTNLLPRLEQKEIDLIIDNLKIKKQRSILPVNKQWLNPLAGGLYEHNDIICAKRKKLVYRLHHPTLENIYPGMQKPPSVNSFHYFPRKFHCLKCRFCCKEETPLFVDFQDDK
jgi:hypothetical protein